MAVNNGVLWVPVILHREPEVKSKTGTVVQSRVEHKGLSTDQKDPANGADSHPRGTGDKVEKIKEPSERVGDNAQSGYEKTPEVEAAVVLERGEDKGRELASVIQS
ncbi:hypothetical protein BFJ66_g11829 [Fusarium oxysporum f. sp. cepae]|uniref:Uncharacterized protein n=1 Tax=Fusarium oxysporum f. sp. cepae TaxID=396571 RepID=A0A3L6NVM8_FUSOX|nr:hypothetical protein BFJ65_g5386 [Fusarium oxysporum f. sp. cepae]RKK39821.1 hypothetical protein BFJ66_g11829 [Fusarium oxysporum f. sp. cepae]RKK48410.1 hypothetical protein BFJ67_g7332 [Fusarium oxysporum f. sp. cepae]